MLQPTWSGGPSSARKTPLWFSVVVALLLVAFCSLYWMDAIKAGKTYYLQTDEVFTLWMVRDAPSVTGALAAGADTAPPGFYYLTKASCRLFGLTPLGLRLPSLGGMFVFVASIFYFLRKYVSWAVAGAAAILPLFTSAQLTEVNARPYAIVMACFALLCFVWCDDGSKKPSLWHCAAIVLLLGFALSMHFYSVVIVPLMFLMELVCSLKHRSVRPRIWVAIVLGAGILLVWLPVILPIFRATHTSALAPGYPTRPSIKDLLPDMLTIFGTPYLFLVLFSLVVAGATYRLWQEFQFGEVETPRQDDLPLIGADSLGTVGFTAFTYPIATFAFAVLVTRVYNLRYIWPSALALSVAFAMTFRRFRWPRSIELALLLVVLGLYANRVRVDMAPGVGMLHPLSRYIAEIPGDAPVVLPDHGNYFALAESNDPAVRNRVAYVLLPDGLTDPHSEPARIARVWMKYKPELRIYTNREFLAKYPHFYILTDGTPGQGLTAWARSSLNAKSSLFGDSLTLTEVTR